MPAFCPADMAPCDLQGMSHTDDFPAQRLECLCNMHAAHRHAAIFAGLACRALSSQAVEGCRRCACCCFQLALKRFSHPYIVDSGPLREDLRVEPKFVVSWGKTMKLVPTQKLVEGVPYICLSKWDRISVRLLSGKALDLRKQKRDQAGSLHCSAWDELLELRQQRANVLLQDALKEDEENHQTKKGQPVRAQSKHAVMLPLSMEVDFHGHKMNILLYYLRVWGRYPFGWR